MHQPAWLTGLEECVREHTGLEPGFGWPEAGWSDDRHTDVAS